MKVLETNLNGCLIIEPKIFTDDRGFFQETFNKIRYSSMAGINLDFVQDNHSRSSMGVLRGLHFQSTKPQGKLVRVVNGEVFDVVVDIRKESPTFGKHMSVIVSGNNKKQFWIPPGFAHGVLVLSNTADFEYKCTDFYDPDDEQCLKWDDPELNIKWPEGKKYISDKDNNAKLLQDLDL